MKARKVLLGRLGFSRKFDPKVWYEANKDELNERRRKRYHRRKRKLRAYKRAYYAANKARFRQNTPEGKFERKLRRCNLKTS